MRVLLGRFGPAWCPILGSLYDTGREDSRSCAFCISDSNSSERSGQQLDLSALLPLLFPRSP